MGVRFVHPPCACDAARFARPGVQRGGLCMHAYTHQEDALCKQKGIFARMCAPGEFLQVWVQLRDSACTHACKKEVLFASMDAIQKVCMHVCSTMRLFGSMAATGRFCTDMHARRRMVFCKHQGIFAHVHAPGDFLQAWVQLRDSACTHACKKEVLFASMDAIQKACMHACSIRRLFASMDATERLCVHTCMQEGGVFCKHGCNPEGLHARMQHHGTFCKHGCNGKILHRYACKKEDGFLQAPGDFCTHACTRRLFASMDATERLCVHTCMQEGGVFYKHGCNPEGLHARMQHHETFWQHGCNGKILHRYACKKEDGFLQAEGDFCTHACTMRLFASAGATERLCVHTCMQEGGAFCKHGCNPEGLHARMQHHETFCQHGCNGEILHACSRGFLHTCLAGLAPKRCS
ncbi:uncharacterized protein LOC125687600 isoform X2 [Lagopus muta]|uniref:uncharacterized protein LOC125687600 isoform X2 n=1 Tax=Lagopus muta TaxID=64668 RepID=UPI00209EF84A|nr:uncharacterized protein LOC125687600 isoform X2 [Lagopus muta]